MEKEKDDSMGTFWFIMLGLGALISVYVVEAWWNARTAIRTGQATAQLMCYQIAITNFNATAGRWPHSLRELETNAMRTVFMYSPTGSKDPWGRPFIYIPFNSAAGLGRVITFGRDGKPGGTGPDADIEQRFP